MRTCIVAIGALAVLGLAATAQGDSFEKKAQVTLGGAEYFVAGYITKIDDNAYWIKQQSGDETRVRVTDATNMVCKSRPEGRETVSERKPGMGFRIGDCPFKWGELVKAEISDEGEATLIRYMDRPWTPKTAELGMPQDFGFLAVPQGRLEFTETPPYAVRALDGESYGYLIGSVMDTELGIAYAVILRDQDKNYYPIPWSKVKSTFPTPGDKPVMVVLETTANLESMHPPRYIDKNQINIAATREYWAKQPAPTPVAKKEFDLDIVVKGKEFHILEGGTRTGNIELLAGTEPTIRIRNEDLVAHEFVSPLFKEVGFSFDGKATLVNLPRATGVRIEPGEAVTLNMKIPAAFDPMYGLFWCNVHGKEHGEKMRGELLIFESKGDRTVG